MPSDTTLPARSRWTDSFHQDRIVLFGGSDRTLDLLRLAVIRSDNVLLVASRLDAATRTFATSFAVDHRQEFETDEIQRATTVLAAIGDLEAENAVVREARATGTPVHVADRPLVSDFNLLEFLERRNSTLKRGARP